MTDAKDLITDNKEIITENYSSDKIKMIYDRYDDKFNILRIFNTLYAKMCIDYIKNFYIESCNNNEKIMKLLYMLETIENNINTLMETLRGAPYRAKMLFNNSYEDINNKGTVFYKRISPTNTNNETEKLFSSNLTIVTTYSIDNDEYDLKKFSLGIEIMTDEGCEYNLGSLSNLYELNSQLLRETILKYINVKLHNAFINEEQVNTTDTAKNLLLKSIFLIKADIEDTNIPIALLENINNLLLFTNIYATDIISITEDTTEINIIIDVLIDILLEFRNLITKEMSKELINIVSSKLKIE